MKSKSQRLLILCKTYPSPSAKHSETSCVAAMDEKGELVRIFPVPFRMIGEGMQFTKWQWVEARVTKASNDHRKESHKIFVDTIVCDAQPLSTRSRWHARRQELDRLNVFHDFDELERARKLHGTTLALLKPRSIGCVDITPVKDSAWTKKEKSKLLQHQQQAGLFEDDEKDVELLRKLPFDFHYRYECGEGPQAKSYRHKIVDWEAGALFWNCYGYRGQTSDGWEDRFRHKLEQDLPQSDLMFLMGTIHRFPDQWLIISLIYPPKRLVEPQDQPLLI